MEDPRMFENSPRKGWYQMDRSANEPTSYSSRNDFRNQDIDRSNRNDVNPNHVVSYKFNLQFLGVLLSILAALMFGLAFSNLLLAIFSSAELACLESSSIFPNVSVTSTLSTAVVIISCIPPAFVFISSIFALTARSLSGYLITYLYYLNIANIIIFVPIYLIFAILGVLHALACTVGLVPVLKLILPILMAIFGLITHLVLIYFFAVSQKFYKRISPITYNTEKPPPVQDPRPFNNF